MIPMSQAIKCKGCVYLTVNPWAKTLEARAARATSSDCPIHGTGPIRWKPAKADFVESHCGRWWITPIYGGLTRPERYELSRNETRAVGGWKVVGSGSTQRECKAVADQLRQEAA